MTNSQDPQSLLSRVTAALEPHLGLVTKAGSFAAIGVVNALVDLGVYVFCRQFIGLDKVPSNVLAWCVAVTGSYVMNSHLTFAAESGRRLNLRAYGTFAASGIAGLIANTAVLVVGSLIMPELVAKVLAIGASFLVNFSLSHLVVFRAAPKRPGDGK